MRGLRDGTAVAALDVREEIAQPVGLATMLLFSASTLLVLQLALGLDGREDPALALGALWIVILFSAALGAGRSVTRRRQDDSWSALLLSPVDRSWLFVGLAAADAALLLVLHAFVVPVFLVLLHVDVTSEAAAVLAGSVVLADAGFALVGALVGVVAGAARGRQLLSAILILPLLLPVLLVGAAACIDAVGGEPPVQAGSSLMFLALYDATFLALGFGLFPELAVE